MRIIRNSFLRTIGRVLALVFISFILALIFANFNFDFSKLLYDDVHAASVNDWYHGLNLTNGLLRNSSNSSTISQGSSTTFNGDNISVNSLEFVGVSIGSGNYLVFNTEHIATHYAYQLRLYLCGQNSLPTTDGKIYIGSSLTGISPVSALHSTENVSNDIVYKTGSGYSYPYCRAYNYSFDSSQSGNFMAIRFNSNFSTSIAFLGYTLEPMGVSYSTESTTYNALLSAITESTTDIITRINRHNELVDNAITNSENRITSNANSNASTITSNQNSNTQSQIANDNSNQAQTNSNLNKINDSINDDDVDNDQATSYFSNFDYNDLGLSDIITLPLNYINALSDNTCVPLRFTMPFVHNSVTLPCMYEIYETHFPNFLNVWQIISTGIISYWVCINIFASVKGFKDPQSDKVEVMDL